VARGGLTFGRPGTTVVGVSCWCSHLGGSTVDSLALRGGHT
jgi:hypothetical protein